MIDGTFALQISRETVPDFATANIEFDKICDFIFSSDITSTLSKFVFLISSFIKSHNTNFKGVGQPLRIALTGSKFGPGIYDIILSLGKEEVQKRQRAEIA